MQLSEQFRRLSAEVEIFLLESPQNRYIPSPPSGFFAVRSYRRRLFLRLDNGKDIPSAETIKKLIATGECIEALFDCTNDAEKFSATEPLTIDYINP